MRALFVSAGSLSLVGALYACVGEDAKPSSAPVDAGVQGDAASSATRDADAELPLVVSFGERPDAFVKDVTTDTFIDGDPAEQSRNFGAGAILFGDSAGRDGGVAVDPQYSLLRFDLSRIPPSRSVVSATLRLAPVDDPSCTTDPADGTTILGYRVLESWTEGSGPDGDGGGATFTEREPGVAWKNVGAGAPQSRSTTASFEVTLPTPGQDVEIPLTELTKSWVATPETNFGILLATNATSTDGVCIMSRSSSIAEHRPLLTVSLGPP